MFILASLAFPDSALTITPEEPATLQLAIVGLGTLAVYAVLTGWRPRKTMTVVAADPTAEIAPASTPADDTVIRRAA